MRYEIGIKLNCVCDLSDEYQTIIQMRLIILILSALVLQTIALAPVGDIQLFPNTQNSPSLYIIRFKLDNALPTGAYLLIGMDWYSANLEPHHCQLVNTSIPIQCTNFNSPTFTLAITTTQFAKFNPILSPTKIVAIKLESNLLQNTTYSLQLHLINVVPNIQKISPSIEMYAMSATGLIYEENPNMGAVINSSPNTNLLAVSVLNDLSAVAPGVTSTLRAQVTIGNAVSTTLSTFMFTLQDPFSFSSGSLPTSVESTNYATSPIPLYASVPIHSYEILTPHIFMLTFNEKLIVGRKFIIQINQISNPFQIASSNISIYSLNYNTLIPLQAYEMLYPFATTSYTLTMALGLPFNAPFSDSMQYYISDRIYVKLTLLIPYAVPDGYMIRLVMTSSYMYVGRVYADFQSLTYTPIYDYSKGSTILLISGMGPIIVGTTLSITLMIWIDTNTQFQIRGYIDTPTILDTFTSSKYLYEGLTQSSGLTKDNFFQCFQDNIFGSCWRVMSATTYDTSQWFTFRIRQLISNTATSSGSYVHLYLPPTVQISPSFNTSYDCQFAWNQNSCDITFFQTATHLKVIIKATGAFLVSNPNPFPYGSYIYIYLRNFLFPETTTSKTIYPIYATLFKSDVVNPTAYYSGYFLSADPKQNTLSGASINYLSNYATSTAANYQTYTGALRFSSVTPASMNLVVQPNEEVVVMVSCTYSFKSMTLTHMGAYPCTSNIPVSCQFLDGQISDTPILMQKIVIRFSDSTYSTTPFHVLIPDTPIAQYSNHYRYYVGIYNKVTKGYSFDYSGSYQRSSGNWFTTLSSSATLFADVVGKAGSYKQNMSVSVYNPSIVLGATSYVFISTQWSLFENGVTSYSAATKAMTAPATFPSVDDTSPLGLYVANGMYLTILPFTYISSTATFTFWLDNAHMPYTYDLPNYYIYTVKQSDEKISSSNQLIMSNGNTLYEAPLQSLVVTCQDNALGVVNTYCTITFGTSHPLLADGHLRISLSGMTVSTSTCLLNFANGTNIPVTCSSSADNLNLTVVMTGWEFYSAGTFQLVVFGVGISSQSLSQSVSLYLYDSTLQFVIETGVRILTTTIASLHYIALTEILYSYLNPLSYNKMTINFYLPRPLYQDQEFAFVIGQDLSDVNTEVSRLYIQILRQDGTIIYPLYYLDNVNYMIVFDFSDPTQLISSNYTMTIRGISTPVSQLNAFNMIYRRTFDLAYAVTNNFVNVIFPEFGTLETSSISLVSYYNTQGYKQDLVFTLTNINDNVDSNMVWVINFPSYYSPDLFQQDAYCTINGAKATCLKDPTTPYQLLVSQSPVTVTAGIPYDITVVGLSSPRNIYTNNVYPQRFIFVGVLVSSTSSSFVERALLLPYQIIQQRVTGVVKLMDMLGVSSGSLYSFSSIYAQFQLICNIEIAAGSHIFMDLPIEFDNLNDIGFNSIIVFGSTTLSTNTIVLNRKIQVTITSAIPANTAFEVQFPNLPTPLLPCTTEMSSMIVTVTPADRLTVTAASVQQANSAPQLTFVANSLYVSFNHDQPITITAGTFSQQIPITPNTNASFLSNTNIQLTSTGFTFQPSTVFIPLGQKQGSFRLGADQSLVPIVYFYQAIKQEEVNTYYQVSLNMNIRVTNIPVQITLPTTLTLPQGGCTDPFIISLTNPPFNDVSISFTFDNSVYSEIDLYPNPITTATQLDFTSTSPNNTFSFCSSSALTITQIPLSFYISGTDYNSYTFTPSNIITLNVVNSVPNVSPVLSLQLNNQQKSFLDVNFTNNVDGIIFYELAIGSSTTYSLQQMQVLTKAGSWLLESPVDLFNFLYNADRDQRLGQFFQLASTTTIRIDHLHPESPYTLCAYLINSFSVVSSPVCLSLNTMNWGTALKARLSFTKSLSAQELNNVLCYFTSASGTNQLYLVDSEGNSCGNRSVSNSYYSYTGSSFITEIKGTNIFLFTNPTIIGSDPSPLAFTNLFDVASSSLSVSAQSGAQSTFSITYMSANYAYSSDARLMASPSITAGLSVSYNTPSHNPTTQQLTLGNVQLLGGHGTVYFVLILYKTISIDTTTRSTTVNIRMNSVPSVSQILNCQNWLGQTAQGCARAVYTGVQPLTVIFPLIKSDSLYMLYYVIAGEYPLRPVTGTSVQSDTIVTYNWQSWMHLCLMIMVVLFMI